MHWEDAKEEILIFVSKEKSNKTVMSQCSSYSMLWQMSSGTGNSWLTWLMTRSMSTIEICGVTALSFRGKQTSKSHHKSGPLKREKQQGGEDNQTSKCHETLTP